MNQQNQNIQSLADELLAELYKALGMSSWRVVSRLLSPLFRKPMLRFSQLATTFDQIIVTDGFQAAASWFITNFVKRVEALGVENIPREGPLIIASNHPGAYDSLVIAANAPRDDIKIISSQIPFLKHFPSTREHLLFSDTDAYSRMDVVRKAIRHLNEGGSLLVFARGSIDPDPGYMPEARKELELWSPSLGLFMRKVPQTVLNISIISRVLYPTFIKHPFTAFRKERIDKQRISEFFQVMRQVLKPGKIMVSPGLTFSPPYTIEDFGSSRDLQEIASKIIQQAREQMAFHTTKFLPEKL